MKSLLLLLAASVSIQTAQAELIGYYPFDGDFLDYSGNGHHGIEQNGPISFALDHAGNPESALNLASNFDYIYVEDFYSTLTYPCSISLWLRNPSNAGSTFGEEQIFTSCNAYSIGQGGMAGIRFFLYNNELVIMYANGGSFNLDNYRIYRSNEALQYNRWYQVTAVLHDEVDATLYVDGAAVGGYHYGGGFFIGTYESASSTIGWYYTQTSYASANAVFDEFMIFDHALTDQEVWNIYSTGNVASANEVATHFELLNNYPNPFNPSTTIRFTLPETGFTNLSVYNAQGQLVRTLLNGLTAGGQHDVDFQADGLSSGTYFYTLETEDHSETRPMVLVK